MCEESPENQENIVTLFSFKENKKIEGPMFKKHVRHCGHGKFTIDSSTDTVICGFCHESLSAMWVLKQLSQAGTSMYYEWQELKREYEKAKNKLRCKCECCGQMTRIKK